MSSQVSFAQIGSKFGTQANDYEKGRDDYGKQVYDQIVTEVLPQTPRTLSVLDLGCGTGISTRGLHKIGFRQVKGLDRDPDMLQKAMRNNEVALRAGSYVQGEVTDLKTLFKRKKFDVITAFASFHWYPTVEAVEAIKKVLKTKGVLAIVGGINQKSEVEQDSQNRFWGLIEKIKGSPVQHPKATAGYDPIKLLKDCGFTTTVHHFESEVLSDFDKAVAKRRSFSGWCNLTEEQKNIGDPLLQELIRDEITRQNRPDDKLRSVRSQNIIIARISHKHNYDLRKAAANN